MIAETLGMVAALCMFGSLIFFMMGVFSLTSNEDGADNISSSPSDGTPRSSPDEKKNPITPTLQKAEEKEKQDLKKEESDIHKLYTTELRTLAAIQLEKRSSDKMYGAFEALYHALSAHIASGNLKKREAAALFAYVKGLEKHACQLGQWKREGQNIVRLEKRDEQRMITAYNRVLSDVKKTEHDSKKMNELIDIWSSEFNKLERDNHQSGDKKSHHYNRVSSANKHHRAEMDARIKELKSSLDDIDGDLKDRINLTLAQWVSLINARKLIVKEDKKLAKIIRTKKVPSIKRGDEPLEKAFKQITKFVDKKRPISETNGASTIETTLQKTFTLLESNKHAFERSRDSWTYFYRQAAAIITTLHKLEKRVHRERKKMKKATSNKVGGI
jgi:hypothetical protein